MGRSTGAQGSKYGKKCKLCRKCDSLQSKECNQYCVWMSGSKECQVCHKEPDCKPCDPWNQHCKSEEPDLFGTGFGTEGKDSSPKKPSKKSDNESGEGSTEQNSESSEYYDDSYEEVSSEKSKDKPEKGHVSH